MNKVGERAQSRTAEIVGVMARIQDITQEITVINTNANRLPDLSKEIAEINENVKRIRQAAIIMMTKINKALI